MCFPMWHHIHKYYSKCIINVNVRAKTVRLLEENPGINLYDFQVDSGFIDMCEKPKAHIKKCGKFDFIKIETFEIQTLLRKWKDNTQMGD